jgi:DNA-binding NtrC family response regulator
MRIPDSMVGSRDGEECRRAPAAATLTSSSSLPNATQIELGGMKSPLILLFTRGHNLDQVIREALLETGAIVLLARDVRDALQIVCQRGRDLDFALMDFDDDYRGVTLLSAVHTCYEQLPIVVTISEDAAHAISLAYANGARTCLKKPLSTTGLTKAIAGVRAPHHRSVAA